MGTGRLTGEYLPIDFAAHARALGAKAYKANSPEALHEALLLAQKEIVTTLIEIPVVPGTNTDGYDSWWRVEVPEVSASGKVTEARQMVAEARKQDSTKPHKGGAGYEQQALQAWDPSY